MNLKNYNIRYDRAVTSWDEALPLGNGKMGCLLYGDGPIRLSLDRVDLWDTRPHPTTLEDGFNYDNLVRLSLSGNEDDWKERARLFEEVYDDLPYPSKITAGRLELDFGEQTEDICSGVDIEKAIGKLSFAKGSLEVYMHATRFLGVAKVYGDYTLSIHIPEYISETGMGYPKASIIEEEGYTYYRQETMTDFSYGVMVYTAEKEGYKELYFTVETNEDGAEFLALAKKRLKAVSEVGYDALRQEHTDWWKAYWEKSAISIGDALLEKTYYQSWYLFASCSRKGFYPMPLQGVWTADNDKLPPWKGDYHHDTNTQLSYQAYLKANRLSEGENFLDYLWELKPQFEKVAREFYNVDGLIIPGVSTIDGKPMGGWAQYSLSPTMSIWTAQSFDEYYLYTGDEEFLRERAFPFLAGVGKAVAGILKEQDGKLYLPLSSSPEIYDDEPRAYLKANSNFDLALMRYLYTRLIRYCEILGEDASDYETVLSKLDDIALIDGYISLSSEERLPETHRHFSHLMCLYPLHLINYDTEEHRKMYHKAIEELELLGMGLWVGFSYAMCAQIYVMAEMGNAAYEKLRQFADGFVADNGFHLNGDFRNKGYSTFHYRPFTLESLFGYCDALQEMLMQEHQGYLHLFPALPKEWEKREVSFEKFRTYDGLIISAKAEGGFTTKLVIESVKAAKIRVKNTFNRDVIQIINHEQKNIMVKDGFFDIAMEEGKVTITTI